jgi:hypothetical protein
MGRCTTQAAAGARAAAERAVAHVAELSAVASAEDEAEQSAELAAVQTRAANLWERQAFVH